MAQPPKRTFDDILPGSAKGGPAAPQESPAGGGIATSDPAGSPPSPVQAPPASPGTSGQPAPHPSPAGGAGDGGQGPGGGPGGAMPPHRRRQAPGTSSAPGAPGQATPQAPAPAQAPPAPGPSYSPGQSFSGQTTPGPASPGPSARSAGGTPQGATPLGAPARIRYIGPFPWLGWKQLFIPVLFMALIGISVGVLTSVGHSTQEPPPRTAPPIPIIFVFNATSGAITNAGSTYTVTLQGVKPTVLSYGGTSALSLLEATVQPTAYVVSHWKTAYKFSSNPPHGALVPSTPSTSANSVAVTIDAITYDQPTGAVTVQGSMMNGSSTVSNVPPEFGNANFYVDSVNGLSIDGCTIEPGTQCAGIGGANGEGYTTFINQNFAYAQLSGSNFSAANLTDSNLANSNFSGAKLANAILTGANLTNANLSFANMASANFNNAILTDAVLYSVGANNAFFRGANLSGANLSSTNFAGADFTGADLSGVLVNATDLISANLTNANLTNANLSSSDLDGINLTDANLTNANLDKSSVTQAVWTGAFLCNTTMPDGAIANPGC